MLTLSVRSFQTPPTPLHLGLAAELAFGADLLGDAGHLAGEGVELVHHGVDGVLQLQDLALHVDGDLLREVAVRDRGRHLGDVADLAGEVRGHEVDVVGQVLPGAGDALDLGLAAELAFRSDLARDAGHLGGEGAELADHRVHDLADAQELAAQRAAVDLELHGLRQVALGDGADDARDLGRRLDEVADHRVHRIDALGPRAGRGRELAALADLAFLADHPRDAVELAVEPLVQLGDVVEGLRDLAGHAGEIEGKAGGEIPFSEGPEGFEEGFGIELRYAGLDLLHGSSPWAPGLRWALERYA